MKAILFVIVGSALLDVVVLLAAPASARPIALTVASLAVMGLGALVSTLSDPRRGNSDLSLLAGKLEHREPFEREPRGRHPLPGNHLTISSSFSPIGGGLTVAGLLSLVAAGVLWILAR